LEADMSDPTISGDGARIIKEFMPPSLVIASPQARAALAHTRMMFEGDRLWTLGPESVLAFALPPQTDAGVVIRFDIEVFIWRDALPRQTVQVFLGDRPVADWVFTERAANRRAIVIRREDIPGSNVVALRFLTPEHARPKDLGINADERSLGIAIVHIGWESVRDCEKAATLARHYGRRVGHEARKSFDDKIDSGFWQRYITGQNVLDVGFKGYDRDVVPIVEGAIGIDLDYPGYDGLTLPFADDSQDAVYSSHCLEHIANNLQVIRDWYRVTKIGGHIITVVPHAMLYERKRRPPSRRAGWNHQRCYTPQSLLAEFETALIPNSYRVRHLADNDAKYSYDYPTERHPDGCYEIELVIQKIPLPDWSLDD
jgi:hypothetical protein